MTTAKILSSLLLIPTLAFADQHISSASQKHVTVTVDEMHRAYENNEISTQEKTDAAFLSVKGKIERLKLSFDNTMVIIMSAEKYSRAYFYLEEIERDDAKKLRKGMTTTVFCRDYKFIANSINGYGCTFKK
ncbi:TPA: hypothetical protein ACKP1J_002015 [Serratia liquefaciens]